MFFCLWLTIETSAIWDSGSKLFLFIISAADVHIYLPILALHMCFGDLGNTCMFDMCFGDLGEACVSVILERLVCFWIKARDIAQQLTIVCHSPLDRLSPLLPCGPPPSLSQQFSARAWDRLMNTLRSVQISPV
jgi:hypothetical protein